MNAAPKYKNECKSEAKKFIRVYKKLIDWVKIDFSIIT